MKKIIPKRRDVDSDVPAEEVSTWHSRGAHVAHFYNTLSVFFPKGERFFIDSVRHFRPKVRDRDLQEAIVGFIGQEAMHGREHTKFNQKMAQRGLPVAQQEDLVGRLLVWAQQHISRRDQLAVTVALEHFTASLAEILLEHPELLDDCQEAYRRMWLWHAIEETEHKAVAYDVWVETTSSGVKDWARRNVALAASMVVLWALVAKFHVETTRQDPYCQGNHLLGYANLLHYMFLGRSRPITRLIPKLLGFVRPGFHPWDQDNSHQLAQVERIVGKG